MLLRDAVEEIIEKLPVTISMPSVVRKINIVRDQLLRNYGKDIVQPIKIDLIEGQAEYPWNEPVDQIVKVQVNGRSYQQEPVQSRKSWHYYYVLAGEIGLHPVPDADMSNGLVVYHKHRHAPLVSLDEEIGLDPDYDYIVVYGVLKTMMTGNEAVEYSMRYEQMLTDYLAATASTYQIQAEEW